MNCHTLKCILGTQKRWLFILLFVWNKFVLAIYFPLKCMSRIRHFLVGGEHKFRQITLSKIFQIQNSPVSQFTYSLFHNGTWYILIQNLKNNLKKFKWWFKGVKPVKPSCSNTSSGRTIAMHYIISHLIVFIFNLLWCVMYISFHNLSNLIWLAVGEPI